MLHLAKIKAKRFYKTNPVSRVFRYRDPWDNLLYNVILQAIRDNDLDFVKHGDGRVIYDYLKECKQYD